MSVAVQAFLLPVIYCLAPCSHYVHAGWSSSIIMKHSYTCHLQYKGLGIIAPSTLLSRRNIPCRSCHQMQVSIKQQSALESLV